MKNTFASAEPATDELQQVVRQLLETYRENPAAFNFVILNTPSFVPQLPADAVYPLDVLEQIVKNGQAEVVCARVSPMCWQQFFLAVCCVH